MDTVVIIVFTVPCPNLENVCLIIVECTKMNEELFKGIIQGDLIQGEGSESLKTALETRGKTA